MVGTLAVACTKDGGTAPLVSGEHISGPLRVIDGDTVAIGSEKIRLFGIDAPEKAQTCADASGAEFACGSWVTQTVHRTYTAQTANCTLTDIDRYGRKVGTCAVDGKDMGYRLVSDGLAFAYTKYSDRYVEAEKAARVTGRGLHGYTVANPAAFRAAQQPPAQVPPQAGCAIKGNISGNGAIFHEPKQQDYDRVRINVTKGERWFCSASEAVAAGWRRAKR